MYLCVVKCIRGDLQEKAFKMTINTELIIMALIIELSFNF